MAEQHHKYTGILLLVFALLILMGAIFFTIAQLRVMDTAEYKNGNSKMQTAKNNLLVAYILGYIAAGVSIVVAILYFGHVTWGIKSEIPHAILFILLFLLVIVSGIFGFVALNNVDNAGSSDTKGAPGWIWAAEIAGLVAMVLLIISGAWRAQYVSSKSKDQDMSGDMTREATINVPPTVDPIVQEAQIYAAGAQGVATAVARPGSPTYMAPMVSDSSFAV